TSPLFHFSLYHTISELPLTLQNSLYAFHASQGRLNLSTYRPSYPRKDLLYLYFLEHLILSSSLPPMSMTVIRPQAGTGAVRDNNDILPADSLINLTKKVAKCLQKL